MREAVRRVAHEDHDTLAPLPVEVAASHPHHVFGGSDHHLLLGVPSAAPELERGDQ
ncbi:MAG: hypothetical protein V9G19_24755 [Tetrasphaera sp.]